MQDKEPNASSGASELLIALVALGEGAVETFRTSDTFKLLTTDVAKLLDSGAQQLESVGLRRDDVIKQISDGQMQLEVGKLLNRAAAEAKVQRQLAEVLRRIGPRG